MDFRLLERDEIDDEKWDGCIEKSINETPLAYTSNLDIICTNWQGVVIDDYSLVIPLPIVKRLGYQLVQMPPEIQNFGAFYHNPKYDFNLELIFKKYLSKSFKFISYSFVYQNKLSSEGSRQRRTHYLFLGQPYEAIKCRYEARHRSNIKKFEKETLKIYEGKDPSELFRIRNKMSRSNSALKIGNQTRNLLSQLIHKTIKEGNGTLIYVEKDGEVISGGFFIKGRKRDVFLLSVSLKKGKEIKASFGVVDYYIKKMSGQDRILDLCGSDIEGIALFLRGFGAESVGYCQYERNNLPWFLKLVKRYNLYKKLKDILS
ncbi:hypothetical protein [Carboxylicivirga marina]|uniref:BioF2-like acetyltransferase domain-containing protein n=1 Tax=Carboxylicivirga marina TaxID=2800988 RepID=A0ABS1HLX7_9BACT|nr:hypothetical protein [Carboxylicivirga marina]MBK3518676.1 hypothetical protein [Carboxylicivirga marina]